MSHQKTCLQEVVWNWPAVVHIGPHLIINLVMVNMVIHGHSGDYGYQFDHDDEICDQHDHDAGCGGPGCLAEKDRCKSSFAF